MHLAHGAGALSPQHRQDAYFGGGWKRRRSGLFGKGSGCHASSIIRIDSSVNEKIRITGDKPASALDERTINLPKRNVLDLEQDIEQEGLAQFTGDAIERLRERVVLREVIVIDSAWFLNEVGVRSPKSRQRLLHIPSLLYPL